MRSTIVLACRSALIATLALAFGDVPASAAPPRPRRYCPPAARPPDVAPSPMLGSFYPTNFLIVRGNGPVGGGYSPLGQYGASTLAVDGPISPFRETTAPVLTYSRGYDGVVRQGVGSSFSNPLLPRLSPVVYPTRANNAYASRYTRTPPWWPSAINWIDQN